MDSDLETYKEQLAQVESALSSDPSNSELSTLKAELENLISLTQSLASSSSSVPSAEDVAPPPPPAKAKAKAEAQSQPFASGQEVLARYSDGRMYPARIITISGDPSSPLYTVVYKGYGNTEMLPSSSLKHMHSAPPASAPSAASAEPSIGPSATPPPPPEDNSNAPPPPPPTAPGAGADEKAKRKYRNEKKLARRDEKTAIQVEKAASWQKFASKTKGGKKESIFRTSDDPYAKVGVRKSSQPRKPDTLG